LLFLRAEDRTTFADAFFFLLGAARLAGRLSLGGAVRFAGAVRLVGAALVAGITGSRINFRLAAAAWRLDNSCAMALPSSAGDLTVRTPAPSSARYLSAAVPLPPAMTAPA